MYKLIKFRGEVAGAVKQVGNISVSFGFDDPANTDYQQFKKNVLAGETLERPDGTPMTQAEADAYIATLP